MELLEHCENEIVRHLKFIQKYAFIWKTKQTNLIGFIIISLGFIGGIPKDLFEKFKELNEDIRKFDSQLRNLQKKEGKNPMKRK
ncbi:Uncharacterised protein [Legionella wadsworthii]|uniref:Uncharacterized protein n=1 Tax=Legionella wadsworthii TaxID=28088 RepID=A0A378LS78_9GAMM|nr:Uncharacterised protein [Legionella wadsworthii]